jgi:hypothetical protein
MGVRTRGTMRTPLGESGGLEEDRVNRVWTIGGYLVGRIDEWWPHFHPSSDTTECGWFRGAQVLLVLNFRMNDSSHVYNHESWAHSAELVSTILKARFGDSEQRSRRPEDLDG